MDRYYPGVWDNLDRSQIALSELPKISVVIITYNFGKYLKECIESVLSQTLPPYEISICDDHSTDDSWAIITEFHRQFPELIKVHRQKENIGPSKNSNFAHNMATGDFISYIEGDDRWLPQKLELEWKALQDNPSARIAYSNVYTIDPEGSRTKIWDDRNPEMLPSGDVLIPIFSRQFFSNAGGLFRNELIHRSVFDEEGQSDLSLTSFWDWDRKIRYAARFQVAYSGEALVERRLHEGGFSRSQPEVHSRALVQVYEKNFPLLTGRSPEDILRVMVNIEGRIISQRITHASPLGLERYSPSVVMARIAHRLHTLPTDSRRNLERELASPLAQIAFVAAEEALDIGNRKDAFRSYRMLLRYAPLTKPKYVELGARVLFSPKAFGLLQRIYRRVRSN